MKNGTFIAPTCKTLNNLLDEYIDIYGKKRWAISTYKSNMALAEHYIRPQLGQMQLSEINPRVLEHYYDELLKQNAIPNNALVPKPKLITVHIVNDIHKLLRSCFNQAVKWELMEKNPALKAEPPKEETAKREIWTAETLFKALKLCDDPRLALALNLSFCCSLRAGELLGLTWDCVMLDPQSIEGNRAYILVNKELQRVDRQVLELLEEKDVYKVFPSMFPGTTTILVLKKPKTDSSMRKVFMPKAVAEMLVKWREIQKSQKTAPGVDYKDYNLVFASDGGYPMEVKRLNKALKRLIDENDLPPVVFHSFRHASVTYKLKLNGGDIKAVQGDTGHSQTKMVTDVYSHILDDGRQNNAALFQEAFYEKGAPSDEIPQDKLAKLLSNPEVVALLKTLAKTIGQ